MIRSNSWWLSVFNAFRNSTFSVLVENIFEQHQKHLDIDRCPKIVFVDMGYVIQNMSDGECTTGNPLTVFETYPEFPGCNTISGCHDTPQPV